MNKQNKYSMSKSISWFVALLFCVLGFSELTIAQEKPPIPITVRVNTAKQLYFGKIIPLSNSGGYVSVDFNGSPTYNGVVILNGFACSEALYEVEAEPGVLFNIVYPDPNPRLSRGGFYLQMHLGDPNVDSKYGYQFITHTKYTYVHIGGTLDVGSLLANPAGVYSGSFDVTFIQQ